jgi:hypothetical protein
LNVREKYVNIGVFFYSIASDAKKCRAFGRGIQPKGVRTGDIAEFRVITKDAGDGVMKATVTGPGRDLLLFDLFLRKKLFSRWFGNPLSCNQS